MAVTRVDVLVHRELERVLLVDGVVGHMDAGLLQTARILCVSLRRDPHEAVVVDVERQRVQARHQGVDTDVKLQPESVLLYVSGGKILSHCC